MFIIALIKYLTKSNLVEEGIIFVHSLNRDGIHYGSKAWW